MCFWIAGSISLRTWFIDASEISKDHFYFEYQISTLCALLEVISSFIRFFVASFVKKSLRIDIVDKLSLRKLAQPFLKLANYH